MNSAMKAAELAGTTLDRYYHACAFFHSRDEGYRVVSPFIKEGLDRGEKAIHITDPKLRTDHLQRLKASDIDVAGPERTGQLEVLTWQEAYLRDNRFDASAMLTQFDEILRVNRGARVRPDAHSRAHGMGTGGLPWGRSTPRI